MPTAKTSLSFHPKAYANAEFYTIFKFIETKIVKAHLEHHDH